MIDRAGNELKVGDAVLYIQTKENDRVGLEWAHITKFTPQMVEILPINHPVRGHRKCRPERLVKPFREE